MSWGREFAGSCQQLPTADTQGSEAMWGICQRAHVPWEYPRSSQTVYQALATRLPFLPSRALISRTFRGLKI
jgi:hypothetical protein